MCIDWIKPVVTRGLEKILPPEGPTHTEPDDGSAIRTTQPVGPILDLEGNVIRDDPKWAAAKSGGPAATVLAPQKSMASMDARRRKLMQRFQWVRVLMNTSWSSSSILAAIFRVLDEFIQSCL